jgi:hypothetical protein
MFGVSYRPFKGAVGGRNVGGNRLPTTGLIAKFMAPDLTDTIGVSSTLTMTTGTSADLMAATFAVSYEAPWIQADADEGGDVFFDSADSNAPIVRSGAEWYDMLNGSYVWIGPKGIAVYSVDMAAYQSKIQRYLGYYIPALYMEDALEMIDTLEMTA